MVNVWAADITPLLIEEIYRAYYNRVPKWRKEKADKLRNVADRARSVGAWNLMGEDTRDDRTSGRCCIQSVAFGKVCIVRLQ